MKDLICFKVKPVKVHRIAKAEYCYFLHFNKMETYKKIGSRFNFSGCRARQLSMYYKSFIKTKGYDYPLREQQV